MDPERWRDVQILSSQDMSQVATEWKEPNKSIGMPIGSKLSIVSPSDMQRVTKQENVWQQLGGWKVHERLSPEGNKED